MALREILLQQLLLLGAIILAASEPYSNCSRTCGSLHIPYPFGTSKGCYLDPSFLITCNDSTPFLSHFNELRVLNVSLEGEIRVSSHIVRDCPNEPGYNYSINNYQFPLLKYFLISYTKNKFFVVGCNTSAIITAGKLAEPEEYIAGCFSLCDSIQSVGNGSCTGTGTGTGCCQTFIQKETSTFLVTAFSTSNDSAVRNFNPCGFSFVAEEEAYDFSSLDLVNLRDRQTVPVVLDWAVGNETCRDAEKNPTTFACKAANSECYNSTNGPGYLCKCHSGYEGNPYVIDGCKDINECEENPNHCNKTCENINITGSFCNKICENIPGDFKCSCPMGYEGDGRTNGTACRPIVGQSSSIAIVLVAGIGISLSILLVGGTWIYWGLKRRNLIKLKEKLFQQNGGLMLQQLLSNYTGSVERAKIFSTEELKRATNNYDESRILGQGGNGTVYKGVLPDNKVVAIKKSKGFDQSQTKQFINEVLLLTQISHRNVVKLLGCCLETEVPLLVYEFITNGTLFYHIHDKIHSSQLSWENRLKIAVEIAGALAYLHSEASMPIIHRDVKTANILLDDNLTAKVADFGASRQISLDQAQVTTLVQGTFGYLDPEYFHTGQLIEKSDVYSFGVVLAELLTSKKAVFSNVTESDRNLSASFVTIVKEDRVLQILDNHIINEGNIEELKEVANLVKRCLSVSGEDRPFMKEVAMELEGLRIMRKNPRGKANLYTEETEYLLIEPAHSFSIDAGTGCSSIYTTAGNDSIGNHLLKPPNGGR